MRELSDAELAAWEAQRRRQVAYRRSVDPRIVGDRSPASQAPHGTLKRYRSGCRCDPCRREGNDYRVIMANRAGEPRRIGL